MKRLLKHLAPALVSAFIFGSTAWAQETSTAPFAPHVGQDGKDVIWVPTDQDMVEVMLDMVELVPEDRLVDLGSGDGRTVITAAKRGTPARGIEYNPDMVAYAQRMAREANVQDMAKFEQGDIFESDFSEATVVTLFLLPTLNVRLRPILLEMPAGTRVVSNSFDMEDWLPDETRKVSENCKGRCDVLMWIVPAKAAGTWKIGDRQLVLNQSFQILDGILREGSASHVITNARLIGNNISFTANGKVYEGVVEGDTIQGVVDGQKWSARRTGPAPATS